MFDDDEPKKPSGLKESMQPRTFEGLSIDELEAYIAFLASETSRAKAEIEHRKSAQSGAESVFK